MIDFPSSPTTGQQYTTSNGVTYVWDGVKWTTSGSAGPAMPLAMNDNRIINGDFRIDQRNNGASGTAAGVYTVDRWQYGAAQLNKGTWARAAIGNAVPGFPYCLGFQSSSAYTPLAADYFAFTQAVEADAISDFMWGTAQAQPVTLSFWASSSLSGTFSGSIRSYGGGRTYPFTFTLPAGGAWAKTVITIPGDTSGTWNLSGNSGGLYLGFDLGCGANNRGPANAWASAGYIGVTGAVGIVATSGAYFNVTGVKLEVGSVATLFNRQSLAKSMADCQRYFQWAPLNVGGYAQAAAQNITYPVTWPTMRASPTISAVALDPSSGLAQAATNSSSSGFFQATPYGGSAFISSAAAGYYSVQGYRCSLTAEL